MSFFVRFLVIQQKVFGLEHPRVAAGLHNLAALLQAQGKHAEADRLQLWVPIFLDKGEAKAMRCESFSFSARVKEGKKIVKRANANRRGKSNT